MGYKLKTYSGAPKRFKKIGSSEKTYNGKVLSQTTLVYFYYTRKAAFTLLADLRLDVSRSRKLFEWAPPFSPRM